MNHLKGLAAKMSLTKMSLTNTTTKMTLSFASSRNILAEMDIGFRTPAGVTTDDTEEVGPNGPSHSNSKIVSLAIGLLVFLVTCLFAYALFVKRSATGVLETSLNASNNSNYDAIPTRTDLVADVNMDMRTVVDLHLYQTGHKTFNT